MSTVQVQIQADQAVAAVQSDTRSSCCLFFRRVLAEAGQGPVWSAFCATMLGHLTHEVLQGGLAGSCAAPRHCSPAAVAAVLGHEHV